MHHAMQSSDLGLYCVDARLSDYRGAVRVTPALATLGASADDVAINKRDGGFLSNEGFETHSSGVVDPHHHLMLVNISTIGRIQKNAAVSHHRAGAVPL